MASNKEIWRNIENYKNYEISNLGRVRSKNREITRKDNIKTHIKSTMLKPQTSRKGYLRVSMYNCYGIKVISVHRLVAKAFIPNPNNLPQINHKDGNKTNNSVDNLEWCNNQYNQLHAIKNGLVNHAKKVIQISKDNSIIKKWDSITEASNTLNIDNSHIGQVCKGERKTAGGYKWAFEMEVVV